MKVKEAAKMLISMDSKRNKKNMVKSLKRILQRAGKISSCIYITDKVENMLKKIGYIKEVKCVKNEDNINTYYSIMLYGEVLDIVLLKVKDNRYKLVPAGKFVEEIGNTVFGYCESNGYVTATFRGKSCKLEDVVDNIVNGNEIESGTCIHHKWFRFCALPYTIVRLTTERHKNLHSLIGNYARNHVAFIENVEEFELLINETIVHNEDLKEKMFSSEF